jgi:undecaprenyl-diphosphatase
MENIRQITRRLSPWQLIHYLKRIPPGRFGWYLMLGGLFCLAITGAFAWLAEEVLENEFAMLEQTLLRWIAGLHNPVNDAIMMFFTRIGGFAGMGVFLIVLAAVLLYYGYRLLTLGVALAGIGGMVINYGLKTAFQRARPTVFPSPLELNSYSFPSGHAMISLVGFGVAAFVAMRLLKRRSWKIAVLVLGVVSTILVGLSRVYFGVHFPTDILGGYIAGSAWLLVSILTVNAAEWYARSNNQ